MTGMHVCPRCELRFTIAAELTDHLRADHGVEFGPQPETDEPETAKVRGTIVVPVDPEREPTIATAVAASVAKQAGLAVQVVAVRPAGLPTANVDAYLYERSREAVAAGAPVASWRDLGDGDPASVLVDELSHDHVAFVCMATRARGAIGEFVLGSVTDAVVRRAPVPVMLVGPHVETVAPHFRHIVVALDGSELAERSAQVAATLAARIGSELYLFEVLGDEPAPPDVAETAYLARVATKLEPRPRIYDAARNHHPGEAILNLVGGAADVLVAMGTHGRTGLSRLVMGSVAHDVTHRASGPVLVVPKTVESWEWPVDED
jgi:nucleotide-binding universal stress UspA family protein